MTDHYDPDIQAQKDYEALNADTRKQLSAALAENEKLRAVVEDFKQFASYLAVKGQYDAFRKTEEYAAFFDNLAALEDSDER